MLDKNFLAVLAGFSLLIVGFFGVGQYVGQLSSVDQTASISNARVNYSGITLTGEQSSRLLEVLNSISSGGESVAKPTTKPADDCEYLNSAIGDMTELYNSCMSDYNKNCPAGIQLSPMRERVCGARYQACGNILNVVLELQNQYAQCLGANKPLTPASASPLR